MLESGCYKVTLQRTGQVAQIISNGTTPAQAYAIAHELSANLVDNGGYTFTGWSTNKQLARFERGREVVFIALLCVRNEVAS